MSRTPAISVTDGRSGTYAGLTVHSPSRLKRFSHGRRHRLGIRLVAAQPGETVLDLGTGDGHFPRTLADARPGVTIVAYEPDARWRGEAIAACCDRAAITIVDRLPALRALRWVTCFDVLEHLSAKVGDELLRFTRHALASDGRFALSVPLEVGLAGLCKNVARGAIGQPHARERVNDGSGYCSTHRGFDFRTMLPRFRDAGLSIERTCYSPLPFVGRLLNAQVFWVLSPRRSSFRPPR